MIQPCLLYRKKIGSSGICNTLFTEIYPNKTVTVTAAKKIPLTAQNLSAAQVFNYLLWI